MWLERLAKQRKGNLQGRDKERGSCCFLSSARGGSVIRSASESRKGFPAPGLRLPSHTQTWNRLGVPAPRQPLPPFRDVRRSPAGPGQPSPSSKVGREDPRPAPPCGSRPAAARLRDLGPAGSRGGAGAGKRAEPRPYPAPAPPPRRAVSRRLAPRPLPKPGEVDSALRARRPRRSVAPTARRSEGKAAPSGSGRGLTLGLLPVPLLPCGTRGARPRR